MKKTICMYDGKMMTVAEYLRKPGVKTFERQMRKLAYESALCNADGSAVDGDGTYPPLKEGFPTHQNRRCRYFETHVLPNDKLLEADYWAIMQGGKVGESIPDSVCDSCRRPFRKSSNRQKYCDDCRGRAERKKAAERQKRQRRKQA